MRTRPFVFTLLLTAALLSQPVLVSAQSGPSFDCAKAGNPIEHAICEHSRLQELDVALARTYRRLLSAHQPHAAEIKQAQKHWLATRNRTCAPDQLTSSDELRSCLETSYRQRLATLMDQVQAPLQLQSIKAVPFAPLQAAYPDTWRDIGYQVLFSPDNLFAAIGVTDSAGYVMQVWLYELASGTLVPASPRTATHKIEHRDDIQEFGAWQWGETGHLYIRLQRPLGDDSIASATLRGFRDVSATSLPHQVQQLFLPPTGLAAEASASNIQDQVGVDADNSYNQQQGGAFFAWSQRKSGGASILMAARAGDTQPRVIAEGGRELEDFLLDPSGTRLIYNGIDGLLVTDPATGQTQRLRGTRGDAEHIRPHSLSSDGTRIAYSVRGECDADATNPATAVTSTPRILCLASLPSMPPLH